MAEGRRPSALTLEFLQEILAHTDPDVSVHSFQVSAGSGRGDNYTSMLFRVKVIGTTKDHTSWKRSLICKYLPDSRVRREAFKSDSLFANEVAFYTKAYPALDDFQMSSAKTRVFSALPKVYLAKGNVVVLEDLREDGFVMTNRKEGMDFEHCLIVFQSLAKLHALSLAMKIKFPEKFEQEVKKSISERLFVPENEEWYRGYYKSAIRNVVDIVQEELSPSNQSDYLKRFVSFADESFFRRMVELVTPQEPISVLTHGDCWANNILFKYSNSGKIIDVRFVDFQLTRYSSPALDIVNFLYCCTTRSLRACHKINLLQIYYQELSSTLTILGCPQERFPNGTLREIIFDEVRRCGKFGLGLALDIIPISTCDSDQAPDLYKSNLDDSDQKPEECGPVYTSSDLCRKRLAELVQELVDERVL